jgi:hypothetical protein
MSSTCNAICSQLQEGNFYERQEVIYNSRSSAACNIGPLAGTGFLYVRASSMHLLDEPVTIDHSAAEWTSTGALTDGYMHGTYELRPDAKRFEQWERNVAAILG